jgi:3-methylfumaryl-CoA hydratase
MQEKTSSIPDQNAISMIKQWEGREEILHDHIVAGPLHRLSATLDHEESILNGGDPVPALGHWLYFLPHHLQSETGHDGHCKRGGFLPPVPLPRRMWAGGRLEWNEANPLRVGDSVQRRSRIESVKHKRGKSGDLVFVQVRHEFLNGQGLAMTELHDIVYRGAAQQGDAIQSPVAAESDAAWQREIYADPVLLFRYSALTFNGHRIHYDRSYCNKEEGYPGLVVHAPLIATLLVDLIRRNEPGAFIKSFEFRAVRPTFDLHNFKINGQPESDGKTIRLWSQDHEGWLTMQGKAELA